jgi:hypothetical protein
MNARNLRVFALLVLSISAAALAAVGCSSSSDSGNPVFPSPTPSTSGTGTQTPTPGASPDVTPLQSWVTPDGKELWLRLEALNFDGTIVNIASRAVNCTSIQLGVAVTVTNGTVHTFRFDSPGTLNCDANNHVYDVQWADSDGNCQGCITDQKNFTFPANTPFAGTNLTVLSNVSARNDPATGAFQITATNAPQTGYTVTLKEARIYTTGNVFLKECNGTPTIGPDTEPAIFDTDCATPPNPVPAGNYNVLFGGTLNGGAEYYQYLPFTYTP